MINLVLVGNKSDLPEYKWEVTAEMGELLAKEINVAFLNTSAKNDVNVTEAFEELIRELRRQREVKQDLLQQSDKDTNCNCLVL